MVNAKDDLEMEDAEATPSPSTEPAGKEPSEKAFNLPEQLRRNLALLEQAVALRELRLISGRLQRQTAAVRRELTAPVLLDVVQDALPTGTPIRDQLLLHLQKVGSAAMETDGLSAGPSGVPLKKSEGDGAKPAGLLPEVEIYLALLVMMFLIDHQHFQQAHELAQQAMQRIAEFNRRTLDALAARIYFYWAWTTEKTGELSDIRGRLLAIHRTAVLRHDEYGQETVLNLLLRNYLHYNQYEQAEQLRSKAQRPEQSRQHTQLCRYLYYLGRIRAITLDYTDAKDCFQQAARKAPTSAIGFRAAATKWLVLVRLLLGEIPGHLDFVQPGLQQRLQPYYEITQAVRVGDLSLFRKAAELHAAAFSADKTHNLVVRLRHNVIRAGLKRISLAYSRISLKDIASKLGLQNVEDTESIVAKAIRDGGIDAVVDHAAGSMSSKEVVDIYSTDEPQAALHARVAFCLDIHNEAVKAMRFEPGAHKKKLEKVQRERTVSDEEIAKAIEDSLEED